MLVVALIAVQQCMKHVKSMKLGRQKFVYIAIAMSSNFSILWIQTVWHIFTNYRIFTTCKVIADDLES